MKKMSIEHVLTSHTNWNFQNRGAFTTPSMQSFSCHMLKQKYTVPISRDLHPKSRTMKNATKQKPFSGIGNEAEDTITLFFGKDTQLRTHLGNLHQASHKEEKRYLKSTKNAIRFPNKRTLPTLHQRLPTKPNPPPLPIPNVFHHHLHAQLWLPHLQQRHLPRHDTFQ